MWRDVEHALRLMIRDWRFTCSAVTTLALGVGANTVMFVVVNAVLLRPLPFKDPDRLVVLTATEKAGPLGAVSYPDLVDLRARNSTMTDVEIFVDYGLISSTVRDPETLRARAVSPTLLPFLGIQPRLGRNFIETDNASSGTPVAIVSHGLWQRQFGSDPNALGRTFTLDEQTPRSDGRPVRQIYTVIGVLPQGGWLPPDGSFDVLTPIGQADPQDLTDREGRYWTALARLKSGIGREAASADLDRIARQLQDEHPESNKGFGADVLMLRDWMVEDVRPSLLVLFGAVVCVLLVACTNMANLMLARSLTREREFAIRVALGASRWMIVRQLLSEGLILSALASIVGLVLAMTLRGMLEATLPFQLAGIMPIVVDWRVAAFSALVAMTVTLAFGLGPAIRASKVQPQPLKSGGSASRSDRIGRIQTVLIAGEIAVALVLLIGAGLMLSTLARLQRVDVGLDAAHVSIQRIFLPPARYPRREAVRDFFRELMDRTRALPEVERVSLYSYLPLGVSHSNASYIDDVATSHSAPFELTLSSAAPGYFQTVGVPLVQGRDFSEQDSASGPHAVAIVNRAFVDHAFASSPAIGREIRIAVGDTFVFTVVGVCGNTMRGGRAGAPLAEVIVPAQGPHLGRGMSLIVRTKAAYAPLAALVRQIVRDQDPDLVVAPLYPLTRYLDNLERPRRVVAALIGLFAALALLLACLGTYSVMSYAVARRVHEIGVRMALGAARSDILRLILRQSAIIVLVGTMGGMLGAVATTRLLRAWLFGVTPMDPTTLTVAVVAMTVVAMAAAYLPARRATNYDPMIALREE